MAHRQAVGDRLVGLARPQQRQDLNLPRGQAREGRVQQTGIQHGDLGRDLVRQVAVPGRDGRQRLVEARHRRVLQDEAMRPALDGAGDDHRVVVHAEGEDPGRRLQGPHPADQRQAERPWSRKPRSVTTSPDGGG